MGPGKDTHGTLGPLRRKAVGGPINAPQGEVTHNDGAHVTTDRSDKHGSGAGFDHTRNVTIIEPEDDMTADDESKLTRK